MQPKLSRPLLAGLLLALTIGAYLPVASNGYIWDDDDYVYQNPTLTSVDGLRRMWFEVGAIPQYYPLVHTSYWIEYRLWGLDALGYHVVNVVLHALCALLFWRVLSLLGVPGAWWAGAIFALHPVHVESVAWITERKNVLSGVFYFASLLSFLKCAGFPSAETRERDVYSERLYAVSLLFFIAALLSKTVTVSLPAVLLILYWWKGKTIDRAVVFALAPFFAVGLAFGLATRIYESYLVGAVGAHWDLSGVDRVLIAGRALWFYLGKLMWPEPLIFNYPRWTIDANAAWQYLYPALAAALGATLCLLVGRIGRAPISAAMIFAGTLVPALGFFDVYPMRYSFVADHFQYLASAAPIAFACGISARTVSRAGETARVAALVLGAGLLGVLAWTTWQQVGVYRDAETLWRATLRENPESWLAHSSLCAIEHERSELGAARGHCETMLRLEPENHESHHMFALFEIARGNVEAGLSHYRRALEIWPDFAHSRNGLGAALNAQRRYSEAIPHFEHALALHPDYAEAHTNLGNALFAIGKRAAAIAQHRSAIVLDPSLAAAHNNLAAVLLAQGQVDLAREHLLRVIELAPESDAARRTLARIDEWIRETETE